MDPREGWDAVQEALAFAVSRVVDDPDPMNDREAADGHRYVMRILAAVTENNLVMKDADRPELQPMLESTRYLGASGPDIDYDVASLRPGRSYRISGRRGGASFVGICLYDGGSDTGPAALLDSVDVDALDVASDGSFTWEFSHTDAVRVIVRQYFHDRATQSAASTRSRSPTVSPRPSGCPPSSRSPPSCATWRRACAGTHSSTSCGAPSTGQRPTRSCGSRPPRSRRRCPTPTSPTRSGGGRWATARRWSSSTPRRPDCRYWALQLCDRWFQSYPDRRSNLNDRQVVRESDGRVRIVVTATDPGHPNWIDTGGHTTGVMFFRWLHTDPAVLPTCTVVAVAEVAPPA